MTAIVVTLQCGVALFAAFKIINFGHTFDRETQPECLMEGGEIPC